MRNLLFDAGNTCLKWALYEQGQLSHQQSLNYERQSLVEQFGASLDQWLTQAGTIDGVILCNVAGEEIEVALRTVLSKQFQKNTALTIKNVNAQLDAFGVRSAYKQATQLGADRWVALVAARHHCDGLSCIVDCGTAVTIDVLAADGRHAGGLIIPGMEMMRDSLIKNTDGILAFQRPDLSPLMVTNTAEAVQAGTFAAICGAVQQVLKQCADEFGEPPVCIVTGGNGKRLLSGLPKSTIFDPDWVLKGLAIIAEGDGF